ncbi:MAG: hypothetical protein ABF586_01700 [Sporolactobacillus sp.]
MPKEKKNTFAEEFSKEQEFNEEFSEPLDEHSIEERERAQRTGDNNNFHSDLQGKHKDNKNDCCK